MNYVHGKHISAEQVEFAVGRTFRLEHFAALCNAIAWAEGRSLGLDQISFTERVYVKDNGIDGEWMVDNPNLDHDSPLVKPGLNVFQYKQRDISTRDRSAIFSGLKQDMKGAAQDVFTRTQRKINHYVLYTNIDLSHEQKQELISLISDGYPEGLQAQVIGAAELSAFLNNFPHLRSAYFSTTEFMTWEKAWQLHNRQAILGQAPNLVGRTGVLAEIQAAIDDEKIVAILLAGPPDIGKTRLSIAATKHRYVDTIFAMNGRALTMADLLAVKSPGQNIAISIDDPEQERIEELLSVGVAENLKLILTVASPDASVLMNYGRDPRVKVFAVKPLDEVESRELLKAIPAKFDFSVESWVIEQAGGNPGILLAASVAGNSLRIEGPRFSEQVGSALQARLQMLLGVGVLPAAKALSLMTAVGIRGEAEEETEVLCKTLGDVNPNQLLSSIRPLAGAGFAQLKGNYVEITPPIFANYLAEMALAGRAKELGQLFVTLSPQGRSRLLRRIRQLKGEVVTGFWDELFATGPLSDFTKAIAQPDLLRLVAPAVPERVVSLLHSGLVYTTVAERHELQGSLRRELVWTVDQLLFRSKSAELALRCFALFAEAENEQWSNNSTGVFAECFHPTHAQFPLPLERRLAVLTDLLNGTPSKDQKLLALKGAHTAFDRWGTYTLRRSEGPEPFDAVPRMTYGDVRTYLKSIIELVRPLMNDADNEVATKAGETLIRAIGEFTVQADPVVGIEMLEGVSAQVLSGAGPITLEEYVRALHLVKRTLSGWHPKYESELKRVQNLSEAIDNGSFEIKVKRWVGSWEHGDYETKANGQTIFHSDTEIQGLAQIAANHPEQVSNPLLAWLNSPEAKRSFEFFYLLGKFDNQHQWQEQVEKMGEEEGAERNFASYFGGRASEDSAGVDARLDVLHKQGRVKGHALVGATAYIPGNETGVRRVVTLIQQGSVNSQIVERQLIVGGWMKTLSTAEAAMLLSAIAGPELKNGAAAIDFLAMWVHSQSPIEDELAELTWQILESYPSGGEAWDFDIVAAAIAGTNLDRAFKLLQSYLSLPHDARTWEPLDRHGGNRFWNVLWKADRRRALQLLLEISAEFPFGAWRISWHLPEILNLNSDIDLLLEFAKKSEKNAEFLSGFITGAQEGFWALAIQLLMLYPGNVRVRKNVSLAAEHMGQVIRGQTSQHLEKCAQAVAEARAKPDIPGDVNLFLSELEHKLRKRAEAERRSEEDESVNW